VTPFIRLVGAMSLATAVASCGGTTDYSTRPEVVVDVDSATTLVALGEEFLLADLLALDVVPAASTANVPEAGFQGLEWFDTSRIEAMNSTEPDLERVAAIGPDALVASAFAADQLGLGRLEQLGPVVVVPDGLAPEEQLRFLARAFGRVDEANDLIGALVSARRALGEAVAGDPCVVSLATIYPGPSLAAWVTGPTAPPRSLLEAGCTLLPEEDAGDPDRNGRLFLSPEQSELLDAPIVILLQSGLVEGENAAVEELASDPLWSGLPAVASGRVFELDRLGYPGLRGELELISDLTEILE
jgi:iron complex transport system substrate-binding protein